MVKLLTKKQRKGSFKKIDQKAVSKLLTAIKTTLLTKKQEQELFKRVVDGDEKAAGKLVKANLFLVEKIANKYRNNGKNIKLSELKKQGKIGLEKAIRKYDPKKNYKFSTYSTWWIRQEIHDTLDIK